MTNEEFRTQLIKLIATGFLAVFNFMFGVTLFVGGALLPEGYEIIAVASMLLGTVIFVGSLLLSVRVSGYIKKPQVRDDTSA